MVMRDSFLTKFGTVAVVVVAFIDGILVANHYHSNVNEVKALEGVELQDIFDSYVPEEILIEELPFIELREAPFTSQAPRGDWSSPWSDFAEEAVITMVRQWWKGEDLLSDEQAELTMLDIARFDSSLNFDIPQVQSVLVDFFGIPSAVLESPSIEDLKTLIEEGAIVIVPIDGSILANRHYGNPAPKNHMILVHGWVDGQFITHDPGTRHGEDMKYGQEKILEAIQDLNGESRVLIIQL
ncbi:MAG: hypothetical protein ACI9QC_000398 [Oceanicoccus sp.]|jgi:hypothetical protein